MSGLSPKLSAWKNAPAKAKGLFTFAQRLDSCFRRNDDCVICLELPISTLVPLKAPSLYISNLLIEQVFFCVAEFAKKLPKTTTDQLPNARLKINY